MWKELRVSYRNGENLGWNAIHGILCVAFGHNTNDLLDCIDFFFFCCSWFQIRQKCVFISEVRSMASRNGFFIKNTLYINQVSCIICNEVSSDFEVDSFLDHVFISFLTGRLHGTQLVSFKKKKVFNTCMWCCLISVKCTHFSCFCNLQTWCSSKNKDKWYIP